MYDHVPSNVLPPFNHTLIGAMPLKSAPNVLSMDVIQLSRYVRRRFHVSLLGTDDVDENRDLAFQILALKNGLQENQKEHLKIFYNLLQANHEGFFSHKSTRNLYIGFPYLHPHYRENYRTFAGDTPTPTSSIGDSLLLNAGSFLSQHTFSSATSHLGRLSNDDISRYLHKSHQFDEDVRVNKLYMKILVELLTKRSLPCDVRHDLKAAFTTAAKSWELRPDDEHNVDHLLDLLATTAGLGIEDYGLMSLIESGVGKKTSYLSTKDKLLLLFGLSCHASTFGIEPGIFTIVDNLIFSFDRDYRSLDLKSSLLFVECMSNLRYRERLLDKTVADNIIPRLSKIRMEDLIQLLQCFITLNFRCSQVIRDFESSSTFPTLTVVDVAVLSFLYKELHYSSDTVASKLKKDGHLLAQLADEKLIEQLNITEN